VREDLGEAVLEIRTDDRRYTRGIRKAHGEARRLDSGFDRVGTSVAGVATRVIALGGISLGGSVLVQGIIRARMELDRIDNTLQAGTGSREAAAAEFRFIADESQRLGFDLATAAGQFAQLTAAARGTELQGQAARDIFTAVSEASVVMGLSADQTGGALTAIQQIISKGTVSAEELRGQLGERLPGAFQIAARALGVTTQELGEMLQRGEVMAEDLLPKLAIELRRTFGPQVPAAVKTMRAEFARLRNEVTLLAGMLGAGAGDGLTPAAAGAADGLRALRSVASEMQDEDGIINWAAASAAAIVGLADIARNSSFVLDTIFESTGRTLGAAAAAARLAMEGDDEGVQSVWAAYSEDMQELEERIQNFDAEAFRRRLREQLSRGASLELIDTSLLPQRRDVEDPLRKIDTSGFDDLKRDQGQINEVFREAERIISATRTPVEAYAIEVRRLSEFLQAGLIDQETFNRAVEAAGQEYADAQDEAETATERMSVFAEEAARSIQGHFADFLFDPFDEGVKGMLEGFATALQRMVAEAAAAELLDALVGDSGGEGGGFAAAIGNAIAGAFGGKRAAGGPVSAGRAYLVGEQGPEVIVPRSAGTVVPNGRVGGGGTSVQVIDQRGAGAPPVDVQKQMVNGQEQVRLMVRSEVNSMFADGAIDQNFRASGFSIRRRGMR
jgi:tape measure domain-containing protein